MQIRFALLSVGLALSLAGCGVPGHTHSPIEANQVLPVIFYGGRVLSVQPAVIGSPDGAAGIVAGIAPGVILGAGGGPGRQPGGARAGVAVLGAAIGAAVEKPAAGLEYTVAVDNTRQVVQITQYALPEDCTAYVPGDPGCVLTPIPPGAPVVIRMLGTKARIFPLAMVPPGFYDRIAHGPVPIGPVVRLNTPPHHLSKNALCFGPDDNPLDCERFVYSPR